MGDNVELEIRITGTGGRRHRAIVARGPSQVGGGWDFELPENGGFLASSGEWRDLRRKAETSDTALFKLLTDQGRALFELVFAGDLYAAFLRTYELARAENAWFRLQFSFDDAPLAMDQPWEALVSREGNALALLPQVSIERRLIKASALEMPKLPESGRLRALVAGASPRDLEPIDVKAERRLIKYELGKQVDPQTLEHTSLSSLGKVLTAKETGFDLIHFIGHGDFEGDEGGLWLEDERGEGVRLTGRELPATLRRPATFVFLNICHGGRSAPNPFAGIAEALLRSGVRAVVAMRREISDPGAVALSKNFYKCLARGESLTRALAKARGNVVNAHYGDWAVPMLYLAGEDFALLPPAPPLPIGKLLGPKLDTAEAAIAAAAPLARPLQGGATNESAGGARWKLVGAVAAVAALIVLVLAYFVVEPKPEGSVEKASDPAAPPVADLQETKTTSKKEAAADEAAGGPPATTKVPIPPPISNPPPPDVAVAEKKEAPTPKKPDVAGKTTAAAPGLSDEDRQRCPPPAGVPLEMILVRAAGKTFRQGENGGHKDFGPQHAVTLTHDFCMDRYETTRELWHKVLGMPAPSPDHARLPIASVNREDIQPFLEILNRQQSRAFYRLPTEAEWEFAARAGSTSVFSFGDDAARLPLYGNCKSDQRAEMVLPVGKLKANPWGFHDIHGNVWEWVEDTWSSYSPEDATDPVGRNPRARPVRRGGAFDAAPDNCWSAARRDLDPNRRQKTVGFRIVRTPVR